MRSPQAPRDLFRHRCHFFAMGNISETKRREAHMNMRLCSRVETLESRPPLTGAVPSGPFLVATHAQTHHLHSSFCTRHCIQLQVFERFGRRLEWGRDERRRSWRLGWGWPQPLLHGIQAGVSYRLGPSL